MYYKLQNFSKKDWRKLYLCFIFLDFIIKTSFIFQKSFFFIRNVIFTNQIVLKHFFSKAKNRYYSQRMFFQLHKVPKKMYSKIQNVCQKDLQKIHFSTFSLKSPNFFCKKLPHFYRIINNIKMLSLQKFYSLQIKIVEFAKKLFCLDLPQKRVTFFQKLCFHQKSSSLEKNKNKK